MQTFIPVMCFSQFLYSYTLFLPKIILFRKHGFASSLLVCFCPKINSYICIPLPLLTHSSGMSLYLKCPLVMAIFFDTRPKGVGGGGREGGRDGGTEGGREREREREGGKEGGREGGRESKQQTT